MTKKLYYVVEKELYGDDVEGTTGNKLISVYEMIDNAPKAFITLDIQNEDNSAEAIQNYLDDNGLGDEKFEFIQL